LYRCLQTMSRPEAPRARRAVIYLSEASFPLAGFHDFKGSAP
jgi:hypothetical protein